MALKQILFCPSPVVGTALKNLALVTSQENTSHTEVTGTSKKKI